MFMFFIRRRTADSARASGPEKKNSRAPEPCLPKVKELRNTYKSSNKIPAERPPESGDYGQMKATVLSPTRTVYSMIKYDKKR